MGGNSFISKLSLGLDQLLQENKLVLFSFGSENKQKILNDACREIGTCRKAIKTSKAAIKDDLLVSEPLFFWDNLFRLFWFLNFIFEFSYLLILAV
tara:strand:- start:26 stop:313 length:288 start_codon:yes stop_codon:yes gene_type:complete